MPPAECRSAIARAFSGEIYGTLIAVGFVAGTQRRLRFADNSFESPSGRMTAAVQRFREAVVDRRAVDLSGNRLSFAGEAVATALSR